MKSLNEEFSSVVREHQAGLRSYIRRLGIASDWVDDMAQEVFLVAYRRWDVFDSERDVGRWLYGIARNLVANELRKGRRKARVVYLPLTEKLLTALDEEQIQSSAPEAGRVVQALKDCVKRLPRLSREMLYYRYADQKNARQLSKQYQVSAGAMRLKLMRIRHAVKTCVEGKVA